MDEEKGEWLFFAFNIIAIIIFGISVYLSFVTNHWWLFIVGMIVAYIIGKFTDPKRKKNNDDQ